MYVRFWPETTKAGALLEIVNTGAPPPVTLVETGEPVIAETPVAWIE